MRYIHADGTPATQINRIASHPTMSLLVTAHEDKFIRIFDVTTGETASLACATVWLTQTQDNVHTRCRLISTESPRCPLTHPVSL